MGFWAWGFGLRQVFGFLLGFILGFLGFGGLAGLRGLGFGVFWGLGFTVLGF